MKSKYCFWSACDGDYGIMMEHCIQTARASGVFKEFHIISDRPLEGCECYDAYQFEKEGALFKLHYLKAGMSRLNFDYFIWIDADTVFVRNPVHLLRLLSKAPIHVPLDLNLSTLIGDVQWKGMSLLKIRELIGHEGVMNQVYLGQSAFWIVHHDAIDTVYGLAMAFWHTARAAGVSVDASIGLTYAMQMLCADPEAHLLKNDLDTWASDDTGYFKDALPDGNPWVQRSPFQIVETQIQPAIIHLPQSKKLLRKLVH
jgi:hypothetical protein